MTIYRIQSTRGRRPKSFAKLKRQAEEAIIELGVGRKALLEPKRSFWQAVYREKARVYGQLDHYAIVDRIASGPYYCPVEGRWVGKAVTHQYLIQGRHLDFIQLQSKSPMKIYLEVIETINENNNDI